MKNSIALRLAAIPAFVFAAAAAHAELPAGTASAITGYQTDVVTVLGLLIAAGLAIFSVKKLGAKMGWL